MKNFILLLILPLSIGLGGCKKSPRKINVSGHAIDATTSQPIENAHLVLANYTATGTGYTVDVLDEVYTDADGNYKFEFKNAAGSEYHIVGNADKYYETDKYQNIVPEIKETNDFNINFTPKAWLKLKFVKETNSFTGIQILISEKISPDQYVFVGDIKPDSASVVVETLGNQNNSVDYYVSNYVNATVVSSFWENRSIYCVANDTTFYTIKY
ncbi:MAG: hypothetical protein IPP32_01645 [Bacteroidetes bacterium]|nr:hypothetical protein [Bacteroidota bacterium]